MLRGSRYIIAVAAALLAAGQSLAADPAASSPGWDRCLTWEDGERSPRIDPLCFFEALIERYRQLQAYEDIAQVIQITSRKGGEPQRVETRIGCEIRDGRLYVQTPGSQIRRLMGLDVTFRTTPAMDEAARQYDLWLAPHMALKFAQRPEKDLRPGVKEDFTPTGAAQVTIDDKPLVRLELKSGDGPADECEATFDLFVDPDSLLVERIRGRQRLPGGKTCETTMQITPLHIEPLPDEDEAQGPVAPAEPASVLPASSDSPGLPPQPRSGRPVTGDSPAADPRSEPIHDGPKGPVASDRPPRPPQTPTSADSPAEEPDTPVGPLPVPGTASSSTKPNEETESAPQRPDTPEDSPPASGMPASRGGAMVRG